MRIKDYFSLPKTQLKAKFDSFKVSNIRENWEALLSDLPSNVRTAVLNTPVGVEIECENLGPIQVSSDWITENDNSLRNDGMEFKTRFGIRIHHLFHLLPVFNKSINDQYPDREYTERTSVHVHLDIKNFEEEQIQNLILLYTIAEDTLFSFTGDYRRENIFCVPLRKSMGMDDDENAWHFLKHAKKYTAMNLACANTFGSVEFRHMEGTDNPERLLQWILLLGLLREAARTMDTREIQQAILKLKTDSQYERILSKVFYNFLPMLPWQNHDLDSAVSDAKLFFWSVM